MKTVQKKEIIDDIERRLEGLINRNEIELILRYERDAVNDFISRGYKVQITGLYSVEPVIQKARKGRHIQTGEPINIPEKPAVKFRPGRAMKRAVEELTVEDVKVSQTAPSKSPARTTSTTRTRENFGQTEQRKKNAMDTLNQEE